MPAPGSSADPSDRYALVLDRWREIYGPEQWPVSAVALTREEVARIDQHDGGNPSLLPVRRFGGERIEDVVLLDARTGDPEPAGIYRLWRRPDA